MLDRKATVFSAIHFIEKREFAGDISTQVLVQARLRPQQALTNFVFLVFESKLEFASSCLCNVLEAWFSTNLEKTM
jgi:hypothetical protein